MKAIIRKKHTPAIILTVFGALMIFMGVMNHYYFRSFVFDYGNYNFAFWDYSHFRISDIPTYPGNFLQDHYSFLLFYFAPLFWLFNWLTGTYTLILIQNALIIVAAWYSYKLVKLKSENLYLGAGVVLYYFLLLGRYSTFACDTNLAVMSACFIPIFLYYFEIKKYIVSSIILVLSLLSRENIPIWFIFIFIVLIIQHRKDKKAVAFCTGGILLSILYFILLFKVLIPSVESAEKQFTLFNYAALGADPGEALKYVLTHPIETINLFFTNHLDNPALDGIKTEFYLVYLISGGFVLFYRPQYLIWFIPIVAQKVLNDAPIRWGILTYYSIEVVTLLPLSVFLTLASVKPKKWQNGLTILVCLAALSTTIYKMDRGNRVVPEKFRPEKEKFFYKGFYKTNYNLKETHRILNQIPKDAKVSASEDFFTHLSQRFHIYFFPKVNDAEYIVFSVFDDYFNIPHAENEAYRNKYLTSNEWEIIAQEFPVFLLKKRDEPLQGERVKNTNSIAADTLFCNFEITDTKNVLFASGEKADVAKKVSDRQAHSGKQSLLLTNEIRYGDAIKFVDIERIQHITATVWAYGDVNSAHIVAKFGDGTHHASNTIIEEDTDWKKIELSFWIPNSEKNEKFFMHLWNSGKKEIFFDDFQIIKKK